MHLDILYDLLKSRISRLIFFATPFRIAVVKSKDIQNLFWPITDKRPSETLIDYIDSHVYQVFLSKIAQRNSGYHYGQNNL